MANRAIVGPLLQPSSGLTMRFVLLASFALATANTAQTNSFVSSAAGAGSASSGSVSDSFKQSSGSSSGGERRAEGRYRVTEVAQADAGKLRLTLARDGAVRANDTVELTLPHVTVAMQSRIPAERSA